MRSQILGKYTISINDTIEKEYSEILNGETFDEKHCELAILRYGNENDKNFEDVIKRLKFNESMLSEICNTEMKKELKEFKSLII